MRKLLIFVMLWFILFQGVWMCFKLHKLLVYSQNHQAEMQLIRENMDSMAFDMENLKSALDYKVNKP